MEFNYQRVATSPPTARSNDSADYMQTDFGDISLIDDELDNDQVIADNKEVQDILRPTFSPQISISITNADQRLLNSPPSPSNFLYRTKVFFYPEPIEAK